MDRNNTNRRNVLKSLGISASGAAIGVAAISGNAAARYPVDTDSGEIEDPDWDNYSDSLKNNELSSSSTISDGVSSNGIVTPDDLSIPNPVDLGFNKCAEWGDGKLCLDASGQAQTQYYDCAGKDLRTVTFTLTKQTLDQYGNYEIAFQQSCWVGMDENNCLHAGVEAAGQDACLIVECPWDPTTASTIYSMRQELNPVAKEILEWLDDNSDVNYDPGSPAGTAEIAFAVALLALAFIFGALGTAA